jgi:hypothetical protein
MKRLLPLFLILFAIGSLSACTVNKETNTLKSEFVLLTYVYTTNPLGADLTVMAETSDGNEIFDFPANAMPTYEEIKNKSTNRPYNNLYLIVKFGYNRYDFYNTDINGHLNISLGTNVINDIYPQGWSCVTTTSWTIPSESSLKPGGGGILLCHPDSSE